jgi:hypothetical protein
MMSIVALAALFVTFLTQLIYSSDLTHLVGLAGHAALLSIALAALVFQTAYVAKKYR